MASWGSYVFELCRINANQGLTAEIDWNYTSWSRRCRKILIGLVVRGAKTVVVRGKNRILTRNRKKPEMTVPISLRGIFQIQAELLLFKMIINAKIAAVRIIDVIGLLVTLDLRGAAFPVIRPGSRLTTDLLFRSELQLNS